MGKVVLSLTGISGIASLSSLPLTATPQSWVSVCLGIGLHFGPQADLVLGEYSTTPVRALPGH